MKLKRQFWLGALVGLSAGSILRRLAAGGFSQATIRRTYRIWAPLYRFANLYLLGQLPHLRRLAVERLQLEPGAQVLEIACGTGANLPYLAAQIGPAGRLVGADATPAMLDQARRLVERRGWHNVELLQEDAASLNLGQTFDGVLWVLAASVVPDWQAALLALGAQAQVERAVAHVRPGGWLVVADARLSERWYTRPLNWVADILGLGAAADLPALPTAGRPGGRRPWERLPRYLHSMGYQELLLGFLYVAWGQKGS